jgi:diguanylate cyclase (GGDEF)-like protein
VNKPPDSSEQSVADAEGKLASLSVQIDAMQAALVRLLQDVVSAESRLEQSHAAQLVAVNEQLVVATLTSQANAEAAVQALADAARSSMLDPLTRLPNRTTLLDRFAQAVAQAKRHGTRFALLFLDLDNFKLLNDTHGHAFGDKVLCLVAARMLSAVREADTVSRHGGDEFVILVAELNQPGDAHTVAEKLMAALSAPAEVDGHVVVVTASVGIAIYPDDGRDADSLINRADAAMYESKRPRAGGVALLGASPAIQPAGGAVGGATSQHPTDPTDAARGHAHLREANEKLVLAVLGAQELLAAAEQAREWQTAFMNAVVKELRSPTAPVRIASAMLGRSRDDDPLLPRVQQIVERRMAEMSRLVGNLIEASQTAPRGLALDRRWVDLAQVVSTAVAAYRPAIDRRGQRFELSLPPGALGVLGDAARLEQIVCNLLENACTHTPEGGRISLLVTVDADALTLTVSDDGAGISPQMLPHVFEPFAQGSCSLDLDGIGLGIGLTVVRALVRAHGGDLVAHSAGPRLGSQFVVTLPRAAAAPLALTAGSASGAASPQQ